VLVALAVLTGANGEPLSAAKATSFGLACAAVRSKSTAVGAPTPAQRPSQPTWDYAAELVFGKFTPRGEWSKLPVYFRFAGAADLFGWQRSILDQAYHRHLTDP
jgi:hypothetical protein